MGLQSTLGRGVAECCQTRLLVLFMPNSALCPFWCDSEAWWDSGPTELGARWAEGGSRKIDEFESETIFAPCWIAFRGLHGDLPVA